jgi:hypothetical protein
MRPPPVRRTPVERKSAAIHDGWASQLARKADALNRAAALNEREQVDQTNALARAFAGPNLDSAARLHTIAFTLLTPRDAQLLATRASCGRGDGESLRHQTSSPGTDDRRAEHCPNRTHAATRSAPPTWPESAPGDHLGTELCDSLGPVARLSGGIHHRTDLPANSRSAAVPEPVAIAQRLSKRF